MAASLLELSHELLHSILIEVKPSDLINLMLTSKGLNHYISGNMLLHKDIYARNWDVPANNDVDWELEVRNIVKLGKILDSSSAEVKESYLSFVSERVQSLLNTASLHHSLNLDMLTEQFKGFANVDAFMTNSLIFERAKYCTRQSTFEERQTAAKLHCLYGLMITALPRRTDNPDRAPSECTRSRSEPYQIHGFAKARVYDLREYTEKTLWGPFMRDGSQRVDWEKVEAILIDLTHNIAKYHYRTQGHYPIIWKHPFDGVTPNSFVDDELVETSSSDEGSDAIDTGMLPTQIRELVPSLDEMDPYGVTGTWMRVVCFLDYNELYAYNFMNDFMTHGEQDRGPIEADEGMLGIEERWHVTKIDPPGSDDTEEIGMDWTNFKGTRLPIVHFEGTSRSLHANWDPDANSRVKGTVRQTPEGEIRWTTFSIFGGEERWRSESIQVGGIRSKRGVVGNWFDKDFSETGPAGPTAFWKESNCVGKERIRHPHWPYF